MLAHLFVDIYPIDLLLLGGQAIFHLARVVNSDTIDIVVVKSGVEWSSLSLSTAFRPSLTEFFLLHADSEEGKVRGSEPGAARDEESAVEGQKAQECSAEIILRRSMKRDG
jgi:hypothetical protein